MSSSPSDSDRSAEIDAVIAAWYLAVERGERPDREAFLQQHPHLADELRQFLGDFDRFHERAADAEPGAPPDPAGRFAVGGGSSSVENTPTLLSPEEAEQRPPAGPVPVKIRYFGDYELLREIARGGMGVVYEARQRSLNRPVALKMILAGRLATADEVARFRREAEAAAQLEHPGIVPIYEIGQHGEQHYFTMGYVDGPSLSAKLMDRPLEPRDAVALLRDVALAVHYAHEKGVVHRDLKPSNILLAPRRDGSSGELPYQPRVTDFGLAKLSRADHSLTETGQILGTPSYMPPEQAAGHIHDVGPAADTYSLGAVLYACLTGRPPFQSASAIDTVRQVLEREPVALRELNAAIPQDLETICLKCLEKSIPRRYPSAKAVAEELQRYLDGRPIQARPVSRRERAWRWCKRNPVVAALSVAVVVSLIIGTAVSSYFAWMESQRAISESKAKGKAVEQTGIAVKQTELAQQQTHIAQGALAEQRRLTTITESARREEARQKQLALDAQRIAQDKAEELRLTLYLADLAHLPELADRHQTAEMVRLLSRNIPQEGQSDLRGFDWYYWWDKVQAGGEVIRCPAEVERLAVSSDGRQLAIGCTGGRGYLWDVAGNQRDPLVIDAGSGHWSTLSFHADAPVLFGASDIGAPKAWDTASGQVIAVGLARNIESGPWSPKGIAQTRAFMPRFPGAFSREGDRFLGPDDSRTHLAYWDMPNLIRQGLAEPSNGIYVGGLGENGPVTVFDRRSVGVATGVGVVMVAVPGVQTPPGRSAVNEDERGAPVFGAAVSPDGQWLACGMRTGQALLYDVARRSVTHRLGAHRDLIWDVVFSADSEWLATASQDGLVKLWHVPTGQLGPVYRGHEGPVRCVRFVQGSSLLASAGEDRDIHVWHRDAAGSARRLRGHAGRVDALVAAVDGSAIWSAGRDRTVRRWSLAVRPDERLLPSADALSTVAVSRDGSVMATSTRFGIQLWDARTGQPRQRLTDGKGPTRRSAVISPDGRLIATNFVFQTEVLMTDVETLGPVAKWGIYDRDRSAPNANEPAVSEIPLCMAFTADGQQVVTVAMRTGTVRVHDARSGQSVRTIPVTGLNVLCAFSADGRHLALGGENRVTILSWPDGREVARIELPVDKAAAWHRLAWSPTGDRLAVATTQVAATGVFLLEGEGWRSVQTLAPGRSITDLVFASEGRQLITLDGRHDISQGDLAAWDVATRRLTAEAAVETGWLQFDPNPDALALAPDGETVLVPGMNGRLHRWNWRRGQFLPPLLQPGNPIDDLAWSPDGATVWSATMNNWNLPRSSGTDNKGHMKTRGGGSGVLRTGWTPDEDRLVKFEPSSEVACEQQAFLLAPRAHVAENVTFEFRLSDPLLRNPRHPLAEWLQDEAQSKRPLRHADVSHDGRLAATIHAEGHFVLWSQRKAAPHLAFAPERIEMLPARRVRCAPDDSARAAVALEDGVAMVTAGAGVVWRTNHGPGGVNSVEWSADGAHLVTADPTGATQVLDARTGERLRNYPAHAGAATHALLPRDGRTLITAGEDGQVLVFDRQTGDLRLRLGEPIAPVRALALSPDESILASAGDDSTIRLWRTAALQPSVTTAAPAAIAGDLPVTERRGGTASDWGHVVARTRSVADALLPENLPRTPDALLAARLRELQIGFIGEFDFNRGRFYDPYSAQSLAALNPLDPQPFTIVEVPFYSSTDVERVRAGLSQMKPAEFRTLSRLTSLGALGAPWTNAEITELRDMPALRTLNLSQTQLTDDDMPLFQGLTGLRTLLLSDTAAGDRIVRQAAQLRELEHFGLDGTRVTDQSLESLADCSNLSTLNLSKTAVTDACIPFLTKLPALRQLGIGDTAITLDGYLALLETNAAVRLDPLPTSLVGDTLDLQEALRAEVEVNGQPVAMAEAIRRIRHGERVTGWKGKASELRENNYALLDRLVALESLTVTSALDKTPLQPLAKVADRLRNLSLRGKDLKDAQLAPLAALHRLQRLHLAETQITPAGLKRIATLPIEALRLEKSKAMTMRAIAETFPNLRELSAADCDMSDADMAAVAELTHLEVLNLTGNSGGKQVAEALLKLPRLRWLALPSGVNGEDRDRFQRILVGGDMPRIELLSPVAAPVLPVGVAVDLLKQIDVTADRVTGRWEKVDGQLVVQPEKGARIEIPLEPPEEYTLTAVVEPVDEPNGVALGLRMGRQRFQVMLNFLDREPVSAVEWIDGKGALGGNESAVMRPVFEQGKKSEIVCTVRPGSVVVTSDGTPLLQWTGDVARLTHDQFWKTPHERFLYLGVYGCGYKFHRVELMPLLTVNSNATQPYSTAYVDQLTQSGRLDDALVELESAPAAFRGTATYLQCRANIRVRQRNWRGAVADYDSLVRINPADNWSAFRGTTIAGYGLSQEEWRQRGRQYFERFRQATDKGERERVCQACALRPGLVPDLPESVAYLEQTAALPAAANVAAWFKSADALGAYRLERFADAIRFADAALALKAASGDQQCRCQTLLILAMTRLKAGDAAGAKEALGRAEELQQRLYAGPLATLPADWLDWMVIDLLSREARATLGLPTTAAATAESTSGGFSVTALTELKQAGKLTEALAELERAPPYFRDSPTFLQIRGEIRAQKKQWAEAAKDFAALIQQRPTDHWNWYRWTAIVAFTQEPDAYRQHCQSFYARFRQSTEQYERTSKMCLIRPEAHEALPAFEAYLDKVWAFPAPAADADWYASAKALVLHRRGRSAEAVTEAQAVLAHLPATSTAYLRVQTQLVLVLARHGTGDAEGAKAAWNKAEEMLRRDLPTDAAGTLPADWWHDWLYIQCLVREARATLGLPGGDNR